MQRIQLFLKVVADVDEQERPARLGAEICRQIQRVYGVRLAEVSNLVTEAVPDEE